jgi:MOSC domain-containing protein YiiM
VGPTNRAGAVAAHFGHNGQGAFGHGTLGVMVPEVTAVSSRGGHGLGKETRDCIRLVTGLGVQDDAHQGATVQHLSRVRRDPTQPNLRQVHLISAELHDELAGRGFSVSPGQMGENVTTRGIDLLSLPTGATLRLGEHAVVEVTGLRNPCVQLEGLAPGLMAAVLDRVEDGSLIRKAGVMSIVVADGEVRPGDRVTVTLPDRPHRPLMAV